MAKPDSILVSAPLLANARSTFQDYERRGGSRSRVFDAAGGTKDEVLDALLQCAKAPKRMLGSFDRTKVATYANATGFTRDQVAVALLINVGELD